MLMHSWKVAGTEKFMHLWLRRACMKFPVPATFHEWIGTFLQLFGTCHHTVAPRLLHTPSREERRFLNFNHLSKEFLEQMIPHLKALI